MTGKHEVFPDWPLVVFTTLAVMGAGMLCAPLIAALVRYSAAAGTLVLLPGLAVLAAGLLVSLAHLGRPFRSPLALARLGRSRLSAEVALAGATLLTGTIAVAFPASSPGVALLPGACAVAFLVSLGLVYQLPGQLTWGGGAVFTPLTLGLGFGALSLAAAWDGSFASIAPVAALVLAADVGLFLWRRQAVARIAPSRHANLLLAARFLLVNVVPGCLVLAGLPKGAAGFLGLGILIDRLSFYLLAVQHSTENEIARVEDLIAPDDTRD